MPSPLEFQGPSRGNQLTRSFREGSWHPSGPQKGGLALRRCDRVSSIRAGLRPSKKTTSHRSQHPQKDTMPEVKNLKEMEALLEKFGVGSAPANQPTNGSPKKDPQPLKRTSFRRQKPERTSPVTVAHSGAGPKDAYYNFEEEYSDSEDMPTTARATVLVDGYNVCGAWPKLAKFFSRGDLDEARARLLDACTPYERAHGVNLLVVFDSHVNGTGHENKMNSLGVDVVFSGSITADKWIEKKVEEIVREKGGSPYVTVVTGDYGLQTAASYKGAFVRSSSLFIQELKDLNKEQVDLNITDNQHHQTSLADGLDQSTTVGLLELRRQLAPGDPFYEKYIVPYDKLSNLQAPQSSLAASEVSSKKKVSGPSSSRSSSTDGSNNSRNSRNSKEVLRGSGNTPQRSILVEVAQGISESDPGSKLRDQFKEWGRAQASPRQGSKMGLLGRKGETDVRTDRNEPSGRGSGAAGDRELPRMGSEQLRFGRSRAAKHTEDEAECMQGQQEMQARNGREPNLCCACWDSNGLGDEEKLHAEFLHRGRPLGEEQMSLGTCICGRAGSQAKTPKKSRQKGNSVAFSGSLGSKASRDALLKLKMNLRKN